MNPQDFQSQTTQGQNASRALPRNRECEMFCQNVRDVFPAPPRMPSSLPEVHALPQEQQNDTFHSSLMHGTLNRTSAKNSRMPMSLNQSGPPPYPPCNGQISEAGYVERIGKLEEEIRRKDAKHENKIQMLNNAARTSDAEAQKYLEAANARKKIQHLEDTNKWLYVQRTEYFKRWRTSEKLREKDEKDTVTRGPRVKRRREEAIDPEELKTKNKDLETLNDEQREELMEKNEKIENLEARISLLESGDEAVQAEMRKSKILEEDNSRMMEELYVLRKNSNARIRELENRNKELERQKESAEEQIEQIKKNQRLSGSKVPSEKPLPKSETKDNDEQNQKLEKRDEATQTEQIKLFKKTKDAGVLENQEVARNVSSLQRQLEEKDNEIARLRTALQTRESRDATLQELREDYRIIMEKNDELEKQMKRLEDELEKKNRDIVKKLTGSKSKPTNDGVQKEMKIEEELQTLRDEHANFKAMMEEKIKEKNEKIVALEESNDSLQKPALQVPILKRQAKVRNKDIQKLQNDIKTRDLRIQELEGRIRALEATDQAAQLEAKDREIQRLTMSIEDLLNKLKAQDELISSGNGDLLQGRRQ